MSVIMEGSVPWNDGENAMHAKMRVPDQDNPSSPFLTPNGAYMVKTAPLLGVGALDTAGRPWTTVWGGEPGFANVLDRDIIGMRTLVDRINDPVVEALLGKNAGGTVVTAEGKGNLVGALAIDLETRRRVKLYGRMVAGTVTDLERNEPHSIREGKRGQVQLVVKIDGSLGQSRAQHASMKPRGAQLLTIAQATARNIYTRRRSFRPSRNPSSYPTLLSFPRLR